MGTVDGTSAASPTWAGIIGLLNAHRKSKGRPFIGFANPLLYKIYAYNPKTFQDITYGSNACTEDGCSCQTGFDAAPGWDASTGLGTPNVGAIIAAMDVMDDAREAQYGRL